MPLDGLRAWIAEVEHKLGMRTRVFLALATIAIGSAGAAIYLAIDARDSAVSEADVQTLQRELQSQIESASGTGGAPARLEEEVRALQAQVRALQSKEEAPPGEEEKDGGTSPGKDSEERSKKEAEEALKDPHSQAGEKAG